jgi:hemerythrin-like metal-binding protein
MSTLTWRTDFELAQPRMDATHREFVQQLADLEALAAGRPSAASAALQALLDHTVAHFAQEERWMTQLGFAADNCHELQHRNVLQVLQEVARRLAAEGDALDPEIVPRLVQALAEWFPAHALMMDAALAETMTERGFDPETGAWRRPPTADANPTTGCDHCG